MPKVVAVNEKGRRIGESHPRAKLTDSEVDLIRDLVDELRAGGMKFHEACRAVAAKFDEPGKLISRDTVVSIVTCRRRAQIPARVKRVT